MPVEPDGDHRCVDGRALARILDHWKPDVAYLEKIHAFQSQGVVAAGRMMESFGVVKMGLLIYVPVCFTVRPQDWKKRMGLSVDKDASRRLIVDLFPVCADSVSLKMHDGRAEAGLIAAYGCERQGLFKMAKAG